jgi:ribosome-associated translation inhibitor RaiA
MDHSDALELHANEQLAKVIHFLENEPTPIYIDLVLAPSTTREHNFAELRVKTPHYDKISSYEGPRMYEVLDHVIDVMYRELHEAKRKREDHIKDLGRHDEFKKQR